VRAVVALGRRGVTGVSEYDGRGGGVGCDGHRRRRERGTAPSDTVHQGWGLLVADLRPGREVKDLPVWPVPLGRVAVQTRGKVVSAGRSSAVMPSGFLLTWKVS